MLGSPQFVLCQKLKQLKGYLRTLNKNQFSNLPRRSKVAIDILQHVQRLIRSNPRDVDLHRQEQEALQNLVTCSTAEESFTRQKSRALLVKEGDQTLNSSMDV